MNTEQIQQFTSSDNQQQLEIKFPNWAIQLEIEFPSLWFWNNDMGWYILYI